MNNPSKSRLFLLELIIMIFFFALAGAVTVNLFAQARLTADASSDLTQSALQAQNCAESLQIAQGDLNRAAEFLGGTASGQELTVSYDQNWQTAAEGPYTLTAVTTNQGGLMTATITVNKGDKELFTLTTKDYLGPGKQVII